MACILVQRHEAAIQEGVTKFHFYFVSFSNTVYSLPQLRNRCSTNSCVNCRVSSEVWCFCTAHSLHPIHTRSVLTRDRAQLLHGSRPLAFRLICTVDFSHISICESFSFDHSGEPPLETPSGNSSKHRVDTVAIIYICSVSTSSHTRSGWSK